MSRKGRKATRSAQLGWKEIRGALLTLLRWLWMGVCLLRYLNPFNYAQLLPRQTQQRYRLDAATASSVVHKPSLWERFMQFFRTDASSKRQLLMWAQEQLPGFRITNLTGCWTDGIALCALVDALSPGACPRYDLLKPHHKVNNCRLGLKLAQRHLGIPSTIITPEEMALAASTHIEDKMRQFLSLIKVVATQKDADLADQGTENAYRFLGRTGIIKTPTCSAKGSGLVVGLLGKRCKFDIYTPVTEHLDLHVEIKGPHEDFCSEQITTMVARRRASHTLSADELQPLKKSPSVGNGLQSLPSVDSTNSNNTEGGRIPFDYQCIGDGHFLVSYLPRSEGLHFISIKWKGVEVRGSPFQVTVASTLEKLNEESKNKLRHKRVSFNDKGQQRRQFYHSTSEHDEEVGGGEEEKENVEPVLGNVTAAVLNRSSKVHRSISTTATGKLTKQATVTRRRVLRRVITKGGQEIVIQEVGASPTASRQNSNENSRQSSMDLSRQSSVESFSRPDSPLTTTSSRKSQIRHQNKSFDFEMVYDDRDSERSTSPIANSADPGIKRQNSADDLAGSMADAIMGDAFHMLQMKEVKSKLLKGQHLTFPNRNDQHKPLTSTRSVPAKSNYPLENSMPLSQSDQTEKVTAQNDDDETSEDRQKPEPTASQGDICEPGASARQMSDDNAHSSLKNEYRHRTLTSTKSMPAERVQPNQSHKKLGLTLSVSSIGNTSLCLPSQNNVFEEHMPPRQQDSSDKQDNAQSDNLGGAGSGNSSLQLSKRHSCDDSTLTVKLPLTKTLSDPGSKKKKKIGLERSNTTPSSPSSVPKSNSLAEQCAVALEPDSPDLLKPAHFKSSSFFESQQNLAEMGQSDRTEDTNNEYNQDILSSTSSRTEKPMMWKTRKHAHRLSSSLPTLSRNWTAFDIDPEDDSLTMEEMEALSVAAQRRPKRATLGTSDLSTELQSFDEFNDGTDMLTIPYATGKNNSNLSPATPSMNTPSPPSPNVSPSDSRRSSRRGSLLRQDVIGLQKVSEEESVDTDKSKDGVTSDNDTWADNVPQSTTSKGRNEMTAGDPWRMTNTPEFISRRKSLEPPNRTHGSRTAHVKVPIAKMDRWTQVTYSQIKMETGWTRPVTCVHPRRRMMRNEAIDAFSSDDSQSGPPRTSGISGNKDVPRIVYDKEPNARRATYSASTSDLSNANLLQPFGDTLPPVRQSTVDTVDSGIADSPKDLFVSPPVRTIPKPRFISGHRQVTRSRYRGKIALDPRLVSGSPNNSYDDDGRNPFFRKKVSAGLRFSRSISETRKQKRREDSVNAADKDSHLRRQPRTICTKRRVHFSRRVMLYRRSSSRSSRCSRSLSHDAPSPGVQALPSFVTQNQNQLPDSANTATILEESNGSLFKAAQKEEDVDISPEVKIHVQNNSSPGDKPSLESTFEGDRPDSNPFFTDYFAQLQAASLPSRDGAVAEQNGAEFDIDRGYFSLIDTPSIDRAPYTYKTSSSVENSGSETCSEIARLTDDANVLDPAMLNLPANFPFHRPSISIEDEVFIPLPAIVSDGDFYEDPDSHSSTSEDVELSDSPYLPDPYRCRAFGAGLNVGKVGAKINFQVLTETRGNDCLTVSIKGPRRGTVTETSVTYTGDNLYEVLYEVTRPGHYVINIKWGDFNIPNSPFICKVTY